MRKNRVFGASVSAILLTFFLLPAVAHAANVTVGCPGGSGTYPSIKAALTASGQSGNVITVTGTCNENVSLSNARSLTFIAGPGGAKIVQPQDSPGFDISLSQDITLQNLEIVGTPGSMPGFGRRGVVIDSASVVNIIGCDIHDNEGGGVLANRNSVLVLRGTIIHNNTPNDGLDVFNNSIATVIGSTIQDNGSAGVGGGSGVSIDHSSVSFQNSLIQNNLDEGIGAGAGSSVFLRGSTTIQGHNIAGVIVDGGSQLQIIGPVTIQGNSVACPPERPCGGIFARINSTLVLRGGPIISSNQGPGISVQQGSNLRLGAATVSNNSGDGVHIQWLSIGNFLPSTTIIGNGGASVFCDERSLAIGDLSGFSNVRCGDIEQPNGLQQGDKDKDKHR